MKKEIVAKTLEITGGFGNYDGEDGGVETTLTQAELQRIHLSIEGLTTIAEDNAEEVQSLKFIIETLTSLIAGQTMETQDILTRFGENGAKYVGLYQTTLMGVTALKK